MAPRLNWDKDRKREIVWRKGALPHWWDGWAADVRDVVGDLKEERAIEVARPKAPCCTLELTGKPDVKICYCFSSMELSHEDPILRFVRQVLENSPQDFFMRFREMLEFDYSFHGEAWSYNDAGYLRYRAEVQTS